MTSFRRPDTDNPRERRGGRRTSALAATWTTTPSANAPRPLDRDAGILRRRNDRMLRGRIPTSEAATTTSRARERDIREWKAVWAEVEAALKTREDDHE
jgi:hypothetical protein